MATITSETSASSLSFLECQGAGAKGREKIKSIDNLPSIGTNWTRESHLKPGEARLHSIWLPQPVARTASNCRPETIKSGCADIDNLRKDSLCSYCVQKKKNTGHSPPLRLSLPEHSVYSVHPPEGHLDDHRVLPHIVLADPSLPWRSPEVSVDASSRPTLHNGTLPIAGTLASAATVSETPWLALLTFTREELLLQPGVFYGMPHVSQSPTLSIELPVNALSKISNVATPIAYCDEAVAGNGTADFIFLKSSLFKSLFSSYDASDNGNCSCVQERPTVDQYKYLSHVREVNTDNMALARDRGLNTFALVNSNRCAPSAIFSPVEVFVHLVSITGIPEMRWPSSFQTLVGLCSLHSWSYTAVPPEQRMTHDSFVHLGRELDVLSPPSRTFSPLQSDTRGTTSCLVKRLREGFSLVELSAQTEKKGIGLYRGPLTPIKIPPHPRLDRCSSSGQDLQIKDRQLGMIDTSYSVAWQIGQTIALADGKFVANITSLRKKIREAWSRAWETRQREVLGLKTMPNKPAKAEALSGARNIKMIKRPHQTQQPQFERIESVDCENFDDAFDSLDQDQYIAFATELFSKANANQDEQEQSKMHIVKNSLPFYWVDVLSWILDRMHFDRVPFQYLVTDPSHLPPESMRLFYVDHNWVESMIDGCLSVAASPIAGQDLDCVAIKHGINHFLSNYTSERRALLEPTYGFCLRSDLVNMYPDLLVTIGTQGLKQESSPLRHEIVANGVILGLLDGIPMGGFDSIVLTPPPHQQRFYASCLGTQGSDSIQIQPILSLVKAQWECLQYEKFKNFEDGIIAKQGPYTYFVDDKPNPALFSLALENPRSRIVIPLSSGEESPDGGDTRDGTFQRLLSKSAEMNRQVRTLRMLESCTVLRVRDNKSGGRGIGSRDQQPSLNVLNGLPTLNTVQHENQIFHKVYDIEHPRSLIEKEDRLVKTGISQERDGPAQTIYPKLVNPLNNTTFLEHEDPESLLSRVSAIKEAYLAVANDKLYMTPVRRLPSAPEYKFHVSSILSPLILQTEHNLKQDLLFSIKWENNQQSPYCLTELDIVIPLGGTHRLMQNYTGPGARMLTEHRFNALVSFASSSKTESRDLIIRLLPRSARGYIGVKSLKQLGFVLTLVELNEVKASPIPFTLSSRAYYKWENETQPVVDEFQVYVQRGCASLIER